MGTFVYKYRTDLETIGECFAELPGDKELTADQQNLQRVTLKALLLPNHPGPQQAFLDYLVFHFEQLINVLEHSQGQHPMHVSQVPKS